LGQPTASLGWGLSWGSAWGPGPGAMQVVATQLAPSLGLTLGIPAPTFGLVPGTVSTTPIGLTLRQPDTTPYWGSPWGGAWGSTTPSMFLVVSPVPSALGLSLGLPAPTVSLAPATPQTVSPAAKGLTLGVGTFVVAPTALPTAIGLALGIQAPSITQRISASFSLTLDVTEPEIRGPVVPDSINLTLDVGDPQIISGVSVPSVDLTLGIREFSIKRIAPDALELVLTPVAPRVGAGFLPPAFGLTLGIAAPQIRETASLASISLVLSPNAPAFALAQLVRPAALGMLLDLGAPEMTSFSPTPRRMTIPTPRRTTTGTARRVMAGTMRRG
jgi:hypothetical protein